MSNRKKKVYAKQITAWVFVVVVAEVFAVILFTRVK